VKADGKPSGTYFFTLKTEETCSSETSVYFEQTTWRYIPEGRTPDIYSMILDSFTVLHIIVFYFSECKCGMNSLLKECINCYREKKFITN
jgi:hypothetical protein